MNTAPSVYQLALAESLRERMLCTKVSTAARITVLSASLKGGGATRHAASARIRQGTTARISASFPNHGLDGAGQLGADLLRFNEFCLVFDAPLRRHVRAEVGGGQQLACRLEAGRAAASDGDDVAEEERRAAGVHHIRHRALEMREAFVENRNTDRKSVV